MKIIKIIMCVAAFFAAIFILCWLNAIRAAWVRDHKLDEKILPAIEAVKENDPAREGIIAKLAEDPTIRNSLYEKLQEIGKEDLFPKAYRSEEKIAESEMVHWLLHPNELNTVPAEMVLVKVISVTDGKRYGNMYLFKFRAEEPHWAADKGWMAGIAGPYWKGEVLTGSPGGTFSEFLSFSSMSEEEHFDYLSKAIQGVLIVDTP